MFLYRFICRLLAVFVIAGLVSQPLAVPAAAKGVPFVAMTGVSAMSAMSADMPCCQDDQNKDDQNKNGCKECPLTNCVLQLAQDQPSHAGGLIVQLRTSTLLRTPDDLIADGLIGIPPDHPPRTST